MVPKKTSKETDAILIDNVGQKLIDKCVLFSFLIIEWKKRLCPGNKWKDNFFAVAIGYYNLIRFELIAIIQIFISR